MSVAGDGVSLRHSRRWPEPEAHYRRWYRDRESNDFALGAVQFVEVAGDIVVANLIGQRGLRRSKKNGPPIRYDAVDEGLRRVADHAAHAKASVHMRESVVAWPAVGGKRSNRW